MWTETIAILHYALALAVSIRVLLRPRLEPTVRLSWILVIELVPLVGIIAYILFGEVRMRGAEVQKMADVRDHLTGGWESSPYHIDTPEGDNGPVLATNKAIGGLQAVAGNRVTLLSEDDDAIDDLVAAIDAARHHVHILFYIWLDDVSGRKVADAVIRAARRGVHVRSIIDAIGSRAFSRSSSWQQMKQAGVECVEAFPLGLPIIGALFQRMDLRNHRKIVVIDNSVGFTGSRNCSDKAFAVKPKFAPWVDVFLRIEGPVVRQMQVIFLQDWISYTGEDLGDMLVFVPPAEEPGVVAQVVATGPDLRQGTMADSMVAMLHAARESVVITTPYYVPDGTLDAAIRAAARRGVHVWMIVPERNDSLVVGATSEGFYYGLVQAGVRLFLFKPGLLHAKIMTVDGEVAMFGSANMDRRSFELNYEMNIFTLSTEVTMDLFERQMSYVERSVEITREDIKAWSVWRRLRNNLLALAAPLL
ncbi:cardiolipin synthase [Paracoccus cavernae]|uniref:Cardiolipin synthase n=1 Tax=Paracoccus cavernae TaxID=1571207 RepID=A0ABT8D9M7_9RHOB|nr:cardiolipin synthase [Paracoccus cavernae]